MKTLEQLYHEALRYHAEPQAGKIGVVPTKPYHTEHDLSLAYTPGVAAPVNEIVRDPAAAWRYTSKGNLVAVVTNGTAVLGLGNAGPLAAKPVMEGKAMALKVFADIDAFDIELDAADVDGFVAAATAIASGFGALLLEDIRSPECFEIEERLQKSLSIPVLHDDQHGTAIAVAAAVANGARLTGKSLERLRITIAGAGAAAIGCARMLVAMGVGRERIVMTDSRGVVSRYRDDLTEQKAEFATARRIVSLAEALLDADVFIGLSTGGILTAGMLRTMAHSPLVLALANPEPEISYNEAMLARPDIIFATGRSDYPNQVNNVLVFPYLFRGALDVRATKIDTEMQLAAVEALAALAREEVPTSVLRAGNIEHLAFGRQYILPKPYDPRLKGTISKAVADAAVRSGVARLEAATGN